MNFTFSFFFEAFGELFDNLELFAPLLYQQQTMKSDHKKDARTRSAPQIGQNNKVPVF